MILFHEWVIGAVYAVHCLWRVNSGQIETESLKFMGRKFDKLLRKVLAYLTGMGSRMKLIRHNGAQKESIPRQEMY